MMKMKQPGGFARWALLRRMIAVGVVVVISAPALMAATDAKVTIDNFSFSPAPLTIPVGTTVTWTNQDDIPHSILLQQLNVKSHPLDTHDDFAYKFDKAGTYNYICGLHPFMHGQVVVK
jgi:plastocyanin